MFLYDLVGVLIGAWVGSFGSELTQITGPSGGNPFRKLTSDCMLSSRLNIATCFLRLGFAVAGTAEDNVNLLPVDLSFDRVIGQGNGGFQVV